MKCPSTFAPLAVLCALTALAALGCGPTDSRLQRALTEELPPFPPGRPVPVPRPRPLLQIEDPGYILIDHDSACGQLDANGELDAILLELTRELPGWVTDATVFLNGWRMEFLGDEDHNPARLGIVLHEIDWTPPVLAWTLEGWLRDRKFNDGYSICGFYTVIGWNRAAVSMAVDDGSALQNNVNGTFSFFTDPLENTALVTIASYLEHPDLVWGNGAAVLTRGFSFGWEEGFEQKEHDLLQLAFSRGSSELFVEDAKWDSNAYRYGYLIEPDVPSPGRLADSGFLSWETQGIFKDDHDKRDFLMTEVFSVLVGGAVSTLEPPFTVRPREDFSVWGGIAYDPDYSALKSDDYVIHGLAFDYAVPALSGWDLAFWKEDDEVKEIGVWLDGIEYDPPGGAARGSLSYTANAVLRDKDDKASDYRHNVHVLGFDRTTPPDLVPARTRPGISGPQGYCPLRGDAEGELLILVRNRGESAAVASTTVWTGGGQELRVATPSLEPGATVQLSLTPSGRYCQTTCTFQILVDGDGQVAEGNEGNNQANGSCVG